MAPIQRLALLAVAFAAILVAPAVQADPAATAPASAPSPATALRVMTFNVRYDTPLDGPNAWPRRHDLVVETIRAARPDLLGAQEVLARQADFLHEQLPEFGFVGVGRDDGERKGEFSPVFYRKDRFDVVASGTFWLSPTPDVVGSKGWDANLPRVATWARLRDRRAGGRELLFVNTHWDHKGQVARRESGRLLRARLPELAAGAPVVLVGDLNATEDSDAVQALLAPDPAVAATRLIDAYRAVHPQVLADESTFNGFRGRTAGSRIDFVLHSPHLRALEATIDRTDFDGRYPSDHFPVTAVLAWE